MKLSKVDIDNMAKALSDKLLCSVGLKDAKRIAAQVKRNLRTEDKRREALNTPSRGWI
jgi:Holliday junction resolvase RusA-like endonuclease